MSRPEADARDQLSGAGSYDGDQVRLESRFSPSTIAARRAVLEAERPFVQAFEYADLPGYAVLTVEGPRVTAQVYGGLGNNPWQTLDLSALRSGAVA